MRGCVPVPGVVGHDHVCPQPQDPDGTAGFDDRLPLGRDIVQNPIGQLAHGAVHLGGVGQVTLI